ncbi:MAG TPA: dTMP kinase [Bacteroidota bacterium]|nr:dTMP kinase [Bacteroidota bacterium]
MRGRLIIFEGIDGAGKTTQIELLGRFLQESGFPVVITRWNSSRLVSKALKRAKKAQLLTPYLYSTLHAADFLYRLETIIIPSLYEGCVVIADRYVYTALARDLARHVDRSWVEHLYALAPRPDLAFYCSATPEESLGRIALKRGDGLPNFYEAGMDILPVTDPSAAFRAFQSRVAEEYERISSEHGLISLDMSRPIDDIASGIREQVKSSLAEWERERNSIPPALDIRAIAHHSEGSAFRSLGLVPHRYPGKLIVIEGVDRSAVSRQANYLANEYIARGHDVELCLSGESWVGTEVERKALRKSVLSLTTKVVLATSELILFHEQKILPALKRGAVVVTDGYLGHLVSRYGPAGINPDWFEPVSRVITVRPDFTIFLDAPLQELVRRRLPFESNNLFTDTVFHRTGRPNDNPADLSALQSMVGAYRALAHDEKWYVVPQKGTLLELHERILGAVPAGLTSGCASSGENVQLREAVQFFLRYDNDFSHPRHVFRHALALFDQTVQLHGYGAKERNLLGLAALLHDIGHALADERHEEYTYDAIQRHEWTSMGKKEKAIVATIASFHRVPYASMNMAPTARLRSADQLLVKRLGSLLRLADALDESGRGAVQEVRCYEEGEAFVVDIRSVSKARQEREAVVRKADMFEQVFQRQLIVERNWIERRRRRATAAGSLHGVRA